MSNQKDREDRPSTGAPNSASAPSDLGWSNSKTRIVSLAIVGFLFVLIIGPLSNPVASPYLSGPIAAKISPLHRALFLGHGYRFFGPDPGPGHLLVYQGERSDGSAFEGVFPDSEAQWPRLLYHRWFMLSETMFNENALLLPEAEFEQRVEEYKRQIAEYQNAGKLKFAKELIAERDLEAHQYREGRRRVELLGKAIAGVLAEQNDAETVKLFMQIRQLPLAEEVSSGVALDDSALLSELLPIGQLNASGYRTISPYSIGSQNVSLPEDLPAMEVLK